MVNDKRTQRRIFEVSEDVRMSTNLINIRADEEIFDVRASTDETEPPNLERVGQTVYEHFPDDFDFLAVFTTTNTGPFRFYVDAKNKIEGIGKPNFDDAHSFGSAGRLQGVAYLNTSTGQPLIHELTHNFGVFLDPDLGLDDGTPHWGGVDIPGTLGGLDFEQQGGNQYKITWSPFDVESESLSMAPMELYLWGLLPAEDVPETTVLHGVDPRDQEVGDVVTPESVSSVTMADVQAIHGPRVPSPANASSRFRIAAVVVSAGRWATDAEMAFWSGVMERFGVEEGTATVLEHFDQALADEFGQAPPTATFDYLTQGRGEMNSTLAGESHDLAGLTGAWHDPASSGQGFNLQMAPSGLFGYYYGYSDAGEDLWLVLDLHEQAIEFGEPFTLKAFAGTSGVFGAPNEATEWGRVTFEFQSCQEGEALLTSHSGDQVQEFDLKPIALVDGASQEDCRLLHRTDGADAMVNLNAAWHDPQTSGQGWNLVRTTAGMFGYFYGYTADGEPLWLVTKEVIGDIQLGQPVEYTLLTNTTEAASFESPAPSTELETWGTATLTFENCRTGTADMQGIDGTQVQELEVVATTLGLPACHDPGGED
ncbi:hypothetical protein DZC52_04055 [Wenzhouxiangella sediminis]|uniref:Uncharacterized protein n=2 Tax=Wenzhouxiangella sediminis TaxID=1792836 RepID=A0A3E1KAS5_9GAMM|nr:hypothetical protein DZC52_04055 [Wenzhouxiangella sediminis]